MNVMLNKMLNKIVLLLTIIFLKSVCVKSQTEANEYVYFKLKRYNIEDSLEVKKLIFKIRKIINNEYNYLVYFKVVNSNLYDSTSFERIKSQFNLISDDEKSRTYFSTRTHFKGKDIFYFRKKKKLILKITRLRGRATVHPINHKQSITFIL